MTGGPHGHVPLADGPGNRLATETSPYLLQHARDPVDWYAWGPAARERARSLDRPIFLSVGYAACHWCHVMHRESFMDPATAQDLAAGFVSIKVDREERPDVDALYMDAVQSLTGSGGWPMSVFLTPDGRPFFGGTYFPDRPRHGLASFRQVLAAVREAWVDRRADVEAAADRIASAVAQGQRSPTSIGPAASDSTDLAGVLDDATRQVIASFDPRTGGWGGSPKFPQPIVIELLLREHLRTGERAPLATAVGSLDAMAAGGIRDQLGGGFARYATDAAWLVPHFEQMLYDNAQLASCYLHAWQVTGATRHAEVAGDILGALERDLLVAADDGPVGFGASLDADTDGEEGGTYVWSAAGIEAGLGPDASLFAAAYGVTPDGNWEGRTILARSHDDAALARAWVTTEDDVAARLASARRRLLAVRAQRPQPARDDKVIGAWNGLALVALAEAGRSLPDGAGWVKLATRIAESLQARLWSDDGLLRRSWKDGRPGPRAVLEDHVHLAAGLLALYQTTFDERWSTWAARLMGAVRERFTDPAGGFHDTPADADDLFSRPRRLTDQPLASGNALAVSVLVQLAALTGRTEDVAIAASTLEPVLPMARSHPTAFAQWLIGAGMLLRPLDGVAITGDPDDPATQPLLSTVRSGFRPWQVVACAKDSRTIPLLAGRPMVRGVPTAYVCHGFTCQLPVTDPESLSRELRAPTA